jgi:succinyl-CoA synthetase beta subunit
MNVHEFQAKSLFAQFGVPVPRGKEITSPEAATAWADELNTPVFVVKAQIHAGGRGKAGGVKITKDKAAVADRTERPESAPPADGGRREHRQRAVSVHPRRS